MADRSTIYAPASGAGRAAIAIIRISGPHTDKALQRIAGGSLPADRMAALRTLRSPATGEALDRALVLRFAAPRSFTGEAMAELQITGGRAVLAAVLGALAEVEDLRPAEPGEFALRAFENGKLDLAEVEGLADLVDAQTEAQRRQALRIAGGALSRATEAIHAEILAAMAAIEAEIDFSDQEDVHASTLQSARDHATAAAHFIGDALSTAASGERLREGFHVVIAGPPNAGKSTLMNALAKRDVSIVSNMPGTTRDALEVALDLRGLPIVLVDTAGMRESSDPIEQEGVSRARRRIDGADLTLWLESAAEHAARGPIPTGNVLKVITKVDLTPQRHQPGDGGPIAISAKTGFGVPQLLDRIADLAQETLIGPGPALIAHERHRIAFSDALQALERASAASNTQAELIAEDLRLAARALERIAGRIEIEAVLGHIFQRLCIGK